MKRMGVIAGLLQLFQEFESKQKDRATPPLFYVRFYLQENLNGVNLKTISESLAPAIFEKQFATKMNKRRNL